jgi:hypothetical protein
MNNCREGNTDTHGDIFRQLPVFPTGKSGFWFAQVNGLRLRKLTFFRILKHLHKTLRYQFILLFNESGSYGSFDLWHLFFGPWFPAGTAKRFYWRKGIFLLTRLSCGIRGKFVPCTMFKNIFLFF